MQNARIRNAASKREKKLARKYEKDQDRMILNELYSREVGVDHNEASKIGNKRKQQILRELRLGQKKQLRALAWISFGNFWLLVLLWLARLYQVSVIPNDVKLFLGFLSLPGFIVFSKVFMAHLMKYPIERNYGQQRDTYGTIPLVDDPPRLALYSAVTLHSCWYLAGLFDGGELKEYLTGNSEAPRTILGAAIVSSVPTVLGLAISSLFGFVVHMVCVNHWWGYGERHKLAFYNSCSMIIIATWCATVVLPLLQ